ncbi:hypothetical protein CDL15_Pgr012957 [Punica granatum]|uniref:Sister chromatid cohesion protein n=1 Tax=Punica granatum TaxID=22663 RepID=A0A218XFH9_PUNGR|nr:hypothetical protein CDL15_Pgr012957 [Punica granatum]
MPARLISRSWKYEGKSDRAALAQARVGVSRIYMLIRGNQVSRNKFMASIMRKFDNPAWNDSVVPFFTHCTKILALLPFTVPVELLYLIYSINQIIQVRAGAIEANLKAYCSRLFSRGGQGTGHSNGSIQQEQVAQPLFGNSRAVDLNGTTIQEESFFQPVQGHMGSLDLNGRIPSEAVDKSGANGSAYTEGEAPFLGSSEPHGISGDDLQKILVLFYPVDKAICFLLGMYRVPFSDDDI